jgi:hypothetical protein
LDEIVLILFTFLYFFQRITNFERCSLRVIDFWRCLIDEDWSSIAVNTLVYSHPQFMEAYGNDNISATILSEWLPTKEEAYAAIKLKIERISEQE